MGATASLLSAAAEHAPGALARSQARFARKGEHYRAPVTGAALPVLFLDVDGPLIPFGATRQQLPNGYPTFARGHTVPGADAHPLLTRIDPAHGPRLANLPCQLVWATSWMSDANDCVAPWLGLPPLPVVDWPDASDEQAGGLHWKTPVVVHWAAGRPFAWLGSTTKSERRIAPGSRRTTQDAPFSIVSIPSEASRTTTSPPWTRGFGATRADRGPGTSAANDGPIGTEAGVGSPGGERGKA